MQGILRGRRIGRHGVRLCVSPARENVPADNVSDLMLVSTTVRNKYTDVVTPVKGAA
jgi:hypothetical protein